MPNEHRILLKAGANELGLSPDSDQCDCLLAFLDLLDHWNETYNLSAIRGRNEQIIRHLLDSLSVCPFLRESLVVDVGSGAGFPGIPLAVLDPARIFVLVDANGKKIRFLKQAIMSLKLKNVQAVRARVETYESSQPDVCVVTRAFASLTDTIRLASHLIRDGGRVLAMKAEIGRAELEDLPRGWTVHIHRLKVPGLDEARTLAEMMPTGAEIRQQ